MPAQALTAPGGGTSGPVAVSARPWPANLTVLAAGAIALPAMVFYLIGFEKSNIRIDVVLWCELVAAVLLLLTRQMRWGAVLVGLLAWEWTVPIVLHDEVVKDYLRTCQKYFVTGNLIALAALLVGVVGLVRSELPRSAAQPLPAERRRRRSVLILAPVTILAGVAGGAVATLSFDISSGIGAWHVYGIGGLAGVVITVLAYVAPTSAMIRVTTVGWLLGGIGMVIIGTEAPHDGHRAAALMALLVATTAAAIAVMRPRSATGDASD